MTKTTLTQEQQTALMAIVGETKVTEGRMESLAIAIAAGADQTTLETIRDAVRVARNSETILVPVLHYETLSRGKGWCRQGRGDSARWAERERGEKGGTFYRIDAGHWTVGANDGYSRKDTCEWIAKHITVGGKTWTVAS